MQGTQARSAAANARYDALTEHGLNAMAEADAVAAAIAGEPESRPHAGASRSGMI